ncbi:MAG TPA: GTPase domain-containing protein [Thermoanaerobaculia bacterium]|nr:GTPase domain-containing protein [Thermoanaerobaculia bacterium]
MARLTPEHDALVVRLVYDGPPRSGKTTSLGALAGGMARSVFSPEETAGRTVYFDWLEYVGGSFEGIPIRCQILSVPGQRELTARRHALLAEADAVVFVIHSTPEQLPGAAEHLRDLRSFLASRPSPQPGIVVQANHRDRTDALSFDALSEALGLDGLTLVESVATESQGIREAFVLAVRLALDRARELRTQGSLPAGPGDTDDPDALLAWLQAAENRAAPGPPPASDTQEIPRIIPRLPDSSAPSGGVFPPVAGRMLLQSAAASGAVPRMARDGSWRARADAWHFQSAARHEFERLADARQELLGWAQQHAGSPGRLSPRRCLALMETGWGTWRLWQVVRAEESLRQRLRESLGEATAGGAAALLRAAAERLLETRASFSLEPPLPCRLEVIGEARGQTVYVGFLPPPRWAPPAGELSLPDEALVAREIRPLLEGVDAGRRWSGAELLAALASPGGESPPSPATEALKALLA